MTFYFQFPLERILPFAWQSLCGMGKWLLMDGVREERDEMEEMEELVLPKPILFSPDTTWYTQCRAEQRPHQRCSSFLNQDVNREVMWVR